MRCINKSYKRKKVSPKNVYLRMVQKTIYILAPYPLGHAPSQRFRFEQYLKVWERRGYEWKFYPFYDYASWQTIYRKGNTLRKFWVVISCLIKRFSLLFHLHRADYVFIHREVSHVGPPIFEWVIAKLLRKKYVYDFDDAIWLPNYSETNASFHRIKAYWKVRYCIKWAHKVTVGNQFLATYARQFNHRIEIIPTTIDTSHHQPVKISNEHLSVGWTGTHTTVHYVKDLVPVLESLSKDFEFEFVLISNEQPTFSIPNLRFIKWSKDKEMDDLGKIRIGVMPLKDDIWAQGKCGFKGLQYMAMGIPCVMSPVGVNTEIVEHGLNGMLAENQIEWEYALRCLLTSEVLRKELGRRGRETVQERFSVEAMSPVYEKLFDE